MTSIAALRYPDALSGTALRASRVSRSPRQKKESVEISSGFHYVADARAESGDADAIVRLLDEVLGEARTLREITALAAVRRQVLAAEARIAQLQAEVATASNLLRLDHLTGVLNRRGLEEAWVREAALAERRGAPLTLALIDLDNFKRLNDAEGHQTGDRALVQFAATLRATLRPQDLVARHGGEEFAILFPDTDLPSALQALERAKQALHAAPLALACATVLTFSAGVTACAVGHPLTALVERADGALYAAKRAGKNRAHAVA